MKVQVMNMENITYKEVCDKLFKTGYYISNRANIVKVGDYYEDARIDANNATNKKQLERLLALNQLLNIAEYYNRNTACYNVRYRICYDRDNYDYKVVPYATYNFTYSLEAHFNNEEDAQAVIDNPNFTEILNTIYKD